MTPLDKLIKLYPFNIYMKDNDNCVLSKNIDDAHNFINHIDNIDKKLKIKRTTLDDIDYLFPEMEINDNEIFNMYIVNNSIYESKYKTALNKLFNTIREGYINNTGDIQYIIQSNLAVAQTLNKKLNDLTQIINGVTEDMLASTSGLEEKIKEFDKQNKEHQRKLQEQNKIITSSQASTELNKQMVKYTEQKAKYSNNILGLYSFLNVVALGLLVYVYKSARD